MAVTRMRECEECGCIMSDLSTSPRLDDPYQYHCRNCEAQVNNPKQDDDGVRVTRDFNASGAPGGIFHDIHPNTTYTEFLERDDVEITSE